MVKNLPARQETRVQSLGGEDPLEKEMATSSVSPWKPLIPASTDILLLPFRKEAWPC